MTRSSSSSSTEDEKETRSTSCEFGRVACYLLGTGGVVIKSSEYGMNGAYLLILRMRNLYEFRRLFGSALVRAYKTGPK